MLPTCGYVWQGQEQDTIYTKSVLGDGTKTLRINSIEQTTLYPWISYVIRSQIRNDITSRNLAIWVDSGHADYTMTVRVNSFQIRSSGEYKQNNLLFTATVEMEIIIYDGNNNTEFWRSGPISYSENYEHSNEEQTIREVIFMTIRRCVDQIQQPF